jgi:hypothetical protein
MNKKNRSRIGNDRPKVLFSRFGCSGWGGLRDLRVYRGNKNEADFSHLHDKFWGEGDDPV